MRLSEIAEYIVDNYPNCCLASNRDLNGEEINEKIVYR